jgi:hypothetical protein
VVSIYQYLSMRNSIKRTELELVLTCERQDFSKNWARYPREYDYRFVRNISPDTTGTAIGRALHKNFSLFALKPNVQFTLRETGFRSWNWGRFAISDENNRIGLGFVPEYNGEAQFGSCSEYILVSISPLEQTREN